MVHVDETTPIRGVLLTFSGRMTIYWKTVGGGGTQEFCEIEDYLDEKVIFCEPLLKLYLSFKIMMSPSKKDVPFLPFSMSF